MKILIPLLFLTLGVNANEVTYGLASGVLKGEVLSKSSRYYPSSFESGVAVDLKAGEVFNLGSLAAKFQFTKDGELVTYQTPNIELCVQRAGRPALTIANLYFRDGLGRPSDSSDNINAGAFIVGPCKIGVAPLNFSIEDRSLLPIEAFTDLNVFYDLSYKITKPSAAGTTTSAPILLPPTTDAGKSYFVKLQVSSDLKAWDDVAPGQFLGSDTARFFRIQTTEAE
ncbi:hypothetical protein OAG15_02145 [bacterium]|nr:hypothetical protein [bacterium]